MADELLSANQVVRQLSELGRELDTIVEMLRDVEVDAVEKRTRRGHGRVASLCRGGGLDGIA